MNIFFILNPIFFVIINYINCVEKNGNLLAVNKCCSTNEIVSGRNNTPNLCINLTEKTSLNYSSFEIYDFNVHKEMEKSDKKFNDIFDIVPKKFETDEAFMSIAINTAMYPYDEFQYYFAENGLIYIEFPNTYNRWMSIAPQNLCIDFFNQNEHISTGFWVAVPSSTEDRNDSYLTIAMLISCCFLMVVLMVYAFLPELRNLCGLILMAYVASLLAALLLLAIIRENVFTDIGCIRLTLAIYYFFLASFCWMNVMSYDIWWTFRGYAKSRPIHRRGKPFKFLMYSIYAWGLPLAMTLMLRWINNTDLSHMPWFIKPNIPGGGCFISGGEKLLYLYLPMLILICANWLFYLMTAFNIWRLNRSTSVLDSAAAGSPAAHRSQRQRLLVYLKLSVVMGLNWVFEVVNFVIPQYQLWLFVSNLYNVLIGLPIFLIFVCKIKILRKLKKQYLKYTNKSRKYPMNSRSSSTTSGCSQEALPLQVNINPRGPGSIINNF